MADYRNSLKNLFMAAKQKRLANDTQDVARRGGVSPRHQSQHELIRNQSDSRSPRRRNHEKVNSSPLRGTSGDDDHYNEAAAGQLNYNERSKTIKNDATLKQLQSRIKEFEDRVKAVQDGMSSMLKKHEEVD